MLLRIGKFEMHVIHVTTSVPRVCGLMLQDPTRFCIISNKVLNIFKYLESFARNPEYAEHKDY